ncbi:hypothetical protein BD289DRAFT_420150 [Coniella lustricola]|uniref:Uncharacterized protein n=1 Tax=Coniella lustricola TaxID=2025994 RepID=A0A2T3AMU8_9PEZI|nr:hypothetical protein BD289DRAFT_420150 [Coniella lustricola]
MNNKGKDAGQPGPRHPTDALTEQLNSIMVQMGRIMTAQKSNPDRADLIAINAKRKIEESYDRFHCRLDDIELEIMDAKAVLLRDLRKLREKKQQAERIHAPIQAQQPAPMIIELDETKPAGPTVPVAPMMATGGSPFMANRGILKVQPSPVAPFPDMGGPTGAPKPITSPALARVKPPVDQKRQSPKQPTPKQTPKSIPKSSPPSGRPANKPNPLANTPKPTPKPPASAPPPPLPVVEAAPVVAAPPAPIVHVVKPPPPPAPAAPIPPQNPFTNATFTVDPSNNENGMQPGAANIDLDAILDMDSFGAGGPGDPANMDVSANQSNDTAMDDLDHFFDMEPSTSSNFDDANFGPMDSYMDISNDFDTFQGFE